MVIGGVLAAVMTVIYLMQAGHHPSYYTLAIILALLSFGLGVAYTPWMASFTETVEARNPALTATGLAIWGWIIRVVVFLAFLIIPHVITAVTPLVDYGSTATAYEAKYGAQLTFAQQHANIVALAQKDSVQLANAQKFAPELAAIQANPAIFTALAKNPTSPALQQKAVIAAGGGTSKADIAKGTAIVTSIGANGAAINGVIAAGPELQKIAPFVTQLKALTKVPPAVFSFFKAHGAALTSAASKQVGQWKTWYWICFGGIIFFLLSIPILRGRWSPAAARKDEAEHEAMVQAELAALRG